MGRRIHKLNQVICNLILIKLVTTLFLLFSELDSQEKKLYKMVCTTIGYANF